MSDSKFYSSDPWLEPFKSIIDKRIGKCIAKERHLAGDGTIEKFAIGHFYYGLHRSEDGWVFREWAPNAEKIFLMGTFNDWKEKPEYKLKRINAYGDWEIRASEWID